LPQFLGNTAPSRPCGCARWSRRWTTTSLWRRTRSAFSAATA
jgi:hypothetical protein